jgi:hypothetical protein
VAQISAYRLAEIVDNISFRNTTSFTLVWSPA